ncbi:MAG: outer membrane protein assembly factor BamB family protein [Thermoplasmatota archaeon]
MPNLSEAWKYEAENLVWNVSVAPAGELVAAGSWDGHIHLIDGSGNQRWRHKTGDLVGGVGISRGGEVVVGGSYDKHIYALDRDGKLLFKFKADSYVRGASVSPSGEGIVAACWSGTVSALDRKGGVEWKVELGVSPLCAVAVEGGGALIGCADKTVRRLDASGRELWKLEAGSAVLSVAASARGGLAAAGSTDTHIYLIDPGGKLLWKYRTGGVVRGVALSESGDYLVATSHDRYIYFFERSGRLLWITKVTPEIWSVAVSSTCDAIAVGCRDGSVRMLGNPEILRIQMESARAAIQSAEREDADASEARRLLSESEAASAVGRGREALSAAVSARESAERSLQARINQLLDEKLAEFERQEAELKREGKSASRVEWAIQRARKLREAGRLMKALESARRSEAYLKGAPPEPPRPPIAEAPAAAAAPAEQESSEELRPVVEAEYSSALEEINELGRTGADVTDAMALLEKAKSAIARRDYLVAAEFVSSASKQAQTIAKKRAEAIAKLGEAETAVSAAQAAGADTTEPGGQLKMARDAMEAGEYDLAIDYANQASAQASELKKRRLAEPAAAKAPAAGRAEGVPKCPNCGKKVKPQWKSCPFCRTRLK